MDTHLEPKLNAELLRLSLLVQQILRLGKEHVKPFCDVTRSPYMGLGPSPPT